ncbi:MAG: hypothetical protein ILM98_14205 [Kiritimatiellae bacterium]|nr:hypothetical protein [Kiritimatiellia bacterium]
MNKKRKRCLLIISAFAVLMLASAGAFFVFHNDTDNEQKQTTQKGEEIQPPVELQVHLPFDWFTETQKEGLAIHLSEVDAIVRKDDGFEVSLMGTAALAPNGETYTIELRVKVDGDGMGYYVSDIISCYCNDNPKIHNEFETVKRDCLSFMEKRLVGP